jgi:hypothetical protein
VVNWVFVVSYLLTLLVLIAIFVYIPFVSQWAFWVLISSYLSLASHRQVDLPRHNNTLILTLYPMFGRVLTPRFLPARVRRAAGYASRRPEELAHQGPFDLQVRRPLQHAQEMRCLVKGVEVLG